MVVMGNSFIYFFWLAIHLHYSETNIKVQTRFNFIQMMNYLPFRSTRVHMHPLSGYYTGSCYSIFSLLCMFGKSLFVLLYFFFWPFCLFFFDLRILIIPLISSSGSLRRMFPYSNIKGFLLSIIGVIYKPYDRYRVVYEPLV
jgi:hypothetical protein